MERCPTHRKETHCDCLWCGKKLCDYCIAKQEGRKYYCENCAIRLVPYKREAIPRVLTPAAQIESEPHVVKRRFVLNKEGYFELK